MKEKIHPEWFPEAEVTCLSCGTVWTTGATVPQMRVDICSNCHPFYTGEQRIVDTEGQVDRFLKRLRQRDERIAAQKEREEGKEQPPADVPVREMGIEDRYAKILNENGIENASDVLEVLSAEGDEGLLKIQGIGRKVLSDAKKGLRNLGHDVDSLTEEQAEE